MLGPWGSEALGRWHSQEALQEGAIILPAGEPCDGRVLLPQGTGLPHPALCWALPGAGCVAQGQHLSSGFTLTSGGLCKASWCSRFISCNTKLQGSTQRRTAITLSAARGTLGRAARRRAAQPCPQQEAVLQRHREIGLLGGGSRRWAQL